VGPLNIADRDLLPDGQRLEGLGTETNDFQVQLKEFAGAIRQGRPPLYAAEEVRPVVAMCEAALVSAREHRASP
jgi:predicted dehydrogenase